MAKLEASTIAGTEQYYQSIMVDNISSSNIVLATSAVSNRSAAAVGSQIVRLYCDQDCWIRFGNSTVTAGANDGFSFFLPKGIIEKLIIDDDQYIAVIRSTADGNLYISRAKKSENQ